MRAIILAAGRGERMRPLTDSLPKPLLKVAGKSLIEYHLEKLAAVGVTTVVINHAWLGHKIVDSLGGGSRWGLAIVYSDESTQALETAGGIANALPLLGSEPFWVINGDIWTDFDFSLLPKTLTSGCLAHLLLTKNPEHHPNGDFSINDHLLNIDGAVKYTYTGLGLYHPQLFTSLTVKRMALAPILKQAINQHQISGQILSAQWTDVGTPERLSTLEYQLELEDKE